ncbi:MAG: S8 family peptidase [Vulcanimicrobiota bacterium]
MNTITANIRSDFNEIFHLSAGGTKKEDRASGSHDRITLDNALTGSADGVRSSDTVGVIISSKDPEKLAVLRDAVGSDTKSRFKADLPLVNAFAADIDLNSSEILNFLCGSKGDVRVCLDQNIGVANPIDVKPEGGIQPAQPAAIIAGVDKIWEKGFTGKGRTICIIDSGIAPHPDFGNRIIAFKDFVSNRDGVENAYDDVGHGTFCAGVAAGDGIGSAGACVGAAPEANIVAVKVINKFMAGCTSDGIKAIQWAIENREKYHIDVISMSLGDEVLKSWKDDPLAMAAEKAIEAGIVFCAAAGNFGHKPNSIGNPGYAEHVLTVGASDDKKTVDPHDDILAKFSGKGPTKFDGINKPDILGSGVDITGPSNKGGYTQKSGTSMSCPLVAGMALLLRQAAPEASPGELKDVIMSTARDLNGLPKNHQGAGIIDVEAAFQKLTEQKAA